MLIHCHSKVCLWQQRHLHPMFFFSDFLGFASGGARLPGLRDFHLSHWTLPWWFFVKGDGGFLPGSLGIIVKLQFQLSFSRDSHVPTNAMRYNGMGHPLRIYSHSLLWKPYSISFHDLPFCKRTDHQRQKDPMIFALNPLIYKLICIYIYIYIYIHI